MDLVKVEVKKVIGPVRDTAAVLLGNDEKVFMIFVGIYEAAAIIRELRHETTERPLTHDVIRSILVGFDIEVRRVIISSIVNNVFCATLALERTASGGEGGLRDEVRIDLRASDSIVLALKTQADIWVSRRVFDAVEDVKSQLEEQEAGEGEGGEDEAEEDGGEPEGNPLEGFGGEEDDFGGGEDEEQGGPGEAGPGGLR